ncbi:hypothetical protein JCM8547_004446 [Rhodosporidiobolus lusitaniae]
MVASGAPPPAYNGHALPSASSAVSALPHPSSLPIGSSPSFSNGHSSSSNGFDHGTVAGKKPLLPGAAQPGRQLDAAQYEGEEGFVPLWEGSNLDRREFVRLALQTFEEMGYSGTAQALQAESGFELEDPAVIHFRQAVLEGRWEDVELYLQALPGQGGADLTALKFAIRQQKFLEAMEAKDTKKALFVLRNQLSPLNHDSNRLHFLSSLIMCSSPEDLRARAGWDGAAGQSRQQLLVHLQGFISPLVMLPQQRLATLLSQAQSYQQRHHAVATSSTEPTSLLVDVDPDSPASFPNYTTHVLREHTDEVWRLAWSHDGEWLATAGKDKTVMLWRVRNAFKLEVVFREHTESISCLAWSPDDSILLTAADTIIKMWNMEKQSCIATLARHEYPIGALAWLPDGHGFVSGGMDHKVFFWDLSGQVTARLDRCPSRIIDLAISPCGTKLVCVGRANTTEPHMIPSSRGGSAFGSRSGTPANAAAGVGGLAGGGLGARHEKRVSVFKIVRGRESESELLYELVQPQEVTSVSISSDSRYAIVSHGAKEILYINLEDGTIVRKYEGHDSSHFVLRACFGGASENFVLSGTGDGHIYVYHRDTGRLLHTLSGHARTTVNAVAWNPRPLASTRGAMWASCSDDRTVRVWEIPPSLSAEDGGEGEGGGGWKGPRLRPLQRRGSVQRVQQLAQTARAPLYTAYIRYLTRQHVPPRSSRHRSQASPPRAPRSPRYRPSHPRNRSQPAGHLAAVKPSFTLKPLLLRTRRRPRPLAFPHERVGDHSVGIKLTVGTPAARITLAYLSFRPSSSASTSISTSSRSFPSTTMGFLHRVFVRKDAETKKAEKAAAERERKVGDRHRRLSRHQLGDWESKYGAGQTSSMSSSGEDKTLVSSEAMDKGPSSGSGASTFLSTKSPGGSRSIDFLPRLDLAGFGGAAAEPLAHSPPTPPLGPSGKRASTFSSRPVLAPLQPTQETGEWGQYLSSRKLGVATQQQNRASRTLSMYSTLPTAQSPQIHLVLPVEEGSAGEDDDDVPLAVAAAASIRSRSSPNLPRPSTMYDVSPPLPSSSFDNTTSNKLHIPRSHSRAASLAMPAVLASPSFAPVHSPARSPTMGTFTPKRGTLIDLSEPSKFDPYHQHGRSRSSGWNDDERVVVGDRRKAGQTGGGKKEKEKRVSEGPKIMDFGELEERHKKRMSQLQLTAHDAIAAETAKKQFQRQQQAEAAQQRAKEESIRRRSISSNLHLAAPAAADSATNDLRRRSTASISGLSALLKFGGGGVSSPSPRDLSSASSAQFGFPRPSSSLARTRRQSTQALVQPPLASTSSPALPTSSSSRPPPPRPAPPARRHSLGTLLETSFDASHSPSSHTLSAADLDGVLEAPVRPFVLDAEPVRRGREPIQSVEEGRKEKVKEWRRSGSASSGLSPAGSFRGQGSGDESERSGAGRGGREVPTPVKGARRGGGASTSDESVVQEGKKKKGKHDWLGY